MVCSYRPACRQYARLARFPWAMAVPVSTSAPLLGAFLKLVPLKIGRYPIHALSGLGLMETQTWRTCFAMRNGLESTNTGNDVCIPVRVSMAEVIRSALVDFLLALGSLVVWALAAGSMSSVTRLFQSISSLANGALRVRGGIVPTLTCLFAKLPMFRRAQASVTSDLATGCREGRPPTSVDLRIRS